MATAATKYFSVVAITSATNSVRVSAVNINIICLAHITGRLMAVYAVKLLYVTLCMTANANACMMSEITMSSLCLTAEVQQTV